MGDDDKTTEDTFSRDQVRKMIAAEVRKVREQFADYDDLKRAADAAGDQQTKIDKVLEKLDAAEKRAADAELENTRRKVADKLGLTAREAGRLKGKTEAELLADGEEMIEDLGIDVEARKAGKGKPQGKSKAPTDKGGDDDGDETDDGTDETDDDAQQQDDEPPARTRRRPAENLRSGAPVTRAPAEETDPMKLVADIPRRF